MRLLALVLLLSVASPVQLDYSRKLAWNLPDDVRKRLDQVKFFDYYQLSDEVNPFYLRGDLDGDGKPDYAILVMAKNTNRRFIVICRTGSKDIEILTGRDKSAIFDATRPVPSKENFNWIDAWQIAPRQDLEKNELNEETPPPMKGEGILAEKTESASVIIYWTGKTYHWYQAAD
jgi:hypothetical protein